MRKSRILTVFLTIAVIFTMSFATVPAYAASGTAITTADELKAMENNPSGSYYLANDIEVPANVMPIPARWRVPSSLFNSLFCVSGSTHPAA